MKKNKSILFGAIIIFAFLWSIFLLRALIEQPKTAYIHAARVFAEFNGKMELESKLKNEQNKQQLMLDSLKLDVQVLKTKYTENKSPEPTVKLIKQKEFQVYELEGKLLQQQEVVSAQYTEEIWQQINQYIIEYGQKNGYDYIFGANGAGSLMYGSKAYDITEDIIKHLNTRYEGL